MSHSIAIATICHHLPSRVRQIVPGLDAQAAAVDPGAEASLRSPVALILFNRPQTTARVLAAIRRARPSRLFLIADGPRPDQAGEAELCAAARACAVLIDWECQVETNFSETNLGLKRRLESGLDWVFERAEQAIILEDDCLPGPRFFSFCDELLWRHRADERLLTISGNNFQFGRRRGQASYYFSRYPHIWGWATWRRAWRLHDPDMATWPAARDAGWLADWLQDDAAVQYWSYVFQKNYDTHHTWDYAWTWSCWLRSGLHILPAVNLVSNIGFASGATHTTNERDYFANLPVEDLPFPLQHPTEVERNAEADAFTESVMFSGNLTRLMATARARVRAGRPSGGRE